MKEMERQGLIVLGGTTDGRTSRLQRNIVEDIEEFQNNKRNKVGFTNLYEIYLYKPESPSGILVVMPHRLLFIPGLSDVEQKLCIDYTGQPAERKEKIDCKAKNRN